MRDEDRERRPTPSFEESAQKFKPGPIAPPERDADRPDMSGGKPRALLADHERQAAAMEQPAARGRAKDMPNGKPGRLGPMPGEDGGR